MLELVNDKITIVALKYIDVFLSLSCPTRRLVSALVVTSYDPLNIDIELLL